MCIPHLRLDPKASLFIFIGNLSLAAGILLDRFVHLSGQIERNWLHFVCGLLLGLSIGINLFGFWLARRCGANESGKP